jgi:hypothetical protein
MPSQQVVRRYAAHILVCGTCIALTTCMLDGDEPFQDCYCMGSIYIRAHTYESESVSLCGSYVKADNTACCSNNVRQTKPHLFYLSVVTGFGLQRSLPGRHYKTFQIS